MAELTARRRRAIPTSQFAEPGARKYPIEDRAHAINAKARATQMMNKGLLGASLGRQIIAKANRKLKGK